jgi:hypothetical protein
MVGAVRHVTLLMSLQVYSQTILITYGMYEAN